MNSRREFNISRRIGVQCASRASDNNVRRLGEEKKISYKQLCDEADTRFSRFIPEPRDWPQAINQGLKPVCGLVALYMALQKQVLGEVNIPLPSYEFRKQNSPLAPTLLTKAQSLGFTRNGPIFNVTFLKAILDSFGFLSTAVKLIEQDYHQMIQSELMQGKVVIVACDLHGGLTQFPGVSGGSRSHWALLYGFYTNKMGRLMYLVCHYGDYFEWSGDDLLRSNRELPEQNIRVLNHAPQERDGHFVKGDETLTHFKFGMLSIPLQNRPITEDDECNPTKRPRLI